MSDDINATGSQGFINRPTGTINQYFGDILKSAPLAYRHAVLRMVEDYRAVFGGRDAELAVLDAFLADDDHACALLIAPTGRGKTALLLHWAAQVQQRAQWSVVCVPISIRYQTAGEAATLGSLASALADYHGDTETYHQSPDQMRALVADYLRRPPPNGRRLLVILDGMDEAVGWQVRRDLFPREPGPHLKLVVSARARAHTTRADWLEQVGWRPAQTCDLMLDGLNQAAVQDILRRMGNPLDALATDVDLLAEIARVSDGDPLTIRLLVEALQDGSLTPGNLTRLPPGLEPFVKEWLDDLLRHSTASDALADFLGCCAMALGPLTADDMAQLAPTLHRRAVVRQAAQTVGRFVIGDGSVVQGYVFSHQRLREIFVEQVYSDQERQELQQRFVAYGQAWYADRNTPLPDYLRQFWVAHLREAGEWETLRTVLTEVVSTGDRWQQPWALARNAAEGSYAGYRADLDVLWSHADAVQDIALGVRCALIAASIRSLSGNLSPELLVGLVTVGTPDGKWSASAALEHIRQMPDNNQQAECIMALVDAGVALPWDVTWDVVRGIGDAWSRARALAGLAPHLLVEQRHRVIQEALDFARAIGDDRDRADALAGLVPYLLGEHLSNALDIARTIGDGRSRIVSLVALAPYLSMEQRHGVVQEALDIARTMRDGQICADALDGLAPYLSGWHLSGALDIARAIGDERSRIVSLVALAPHLSMEQRHGVVQETLDIACTMRDGPNRARALDALVPHLSMEQQHGVVQEALNFACAIEDDWSRVIVLRSLAPHLSGEQLSTALDAARAIGDEMFRFAALRGLAPHLAMEQRHDFFQDVLVAVRVIEHKMRPIDILVGFVPYLPEEHQCDMFQYALDFARAIGDERSRAEALVALIPHLSGKQQHGDLQEVLDFACAIGDEWSRADVLVGLAPHLLGNHLSIALDAARAIGDVRSRARVLVVLAPHLSVEQLSIALDTARAIGSEGYRAEALVGLAPYLSVEQLPIALGVARAIGDGDDRARALVGLVPYLSGEQQDEIVQEAMDAARTIGTEKSRANTLVGLAPYLSVEQLPIALGVARAIGDAGSRARVLVVLASHLSVEQQDEVVQESLDVVQAIGDMGSRARVLVGLAPYLSASHIPTALNVARAIGDEWSRVEALVGLTPHLLVEQWHGVWQEALDVARAIGDEVRRAEALVSLAPHLPEEQQQEILQKALDTACTIEYEWKRSRVLAALAPHLPANLLQIVLNVIPPTHSIPRAYVLALRAAYLPPEQQSAAYYDALKTVRASEDKGRRAEILVGIASHLPPEQQSLIFQDVLNAARTTVYLPGQYVPSPATLASYLDILPREHSRTEWHRSLPSLVVPGRDAFLCDLAALTPWLAALAAPDDLTALAQSIIDVARVWP